MVAITYRGLGVIDHNGDFIGDTVTIDEGITIGFTHRSYATLREVQGYILPGFIDAHLHVKGLGAYLQSVDLRGVLSREELIARMASSKLPIVIGRGWDQEAFPDAKPPTKEDLDRAVPERPAVAVRICGHMAVANSKALGELKPWIKYPDYVDKEKGYLYEDAVYYVVNELLSKLDEESMIKAALEALRSSGVAGASSMACSNGEIEALYKLSINGDIPVRISCYANRDNFSLKVGLSTPAFKVVGVKLFADGSLGARTAYLREDYSDDPGNRGRLLLDSKKIADIAGSVIKSGYRVAVHAIGDAALDEVIEAYRIVNPGDKGRIEHASISWSSQIKSISELGVTVVIQPGFRKSDWWINKRLGARASRAYKFREMLRRGVKLAISTDAPVEDHRPWETFRVATGDCGTRRCIYGDDLSPREIITLYTVNAAKASGPPVDALGRIEKGYPALLAYTRYNPLESSWKGPLSPLNF